MERVYEIISQRFSIELEDIAQEWMRLGGDWRKCLCRLSIIANGIGVSKTVVQMVFFLHCAIFLAEEYKKRDLPEELDWGALQVDGMSQRLWRMGNVCV